MLQRFDVSSDVITIRGVVIPPGGTTTRATLVLPPKATTADSNNGDLIAQFSPVRSGTLTITCYETDAAHLALLQLAAQQDLDRLSATREVWAGNVAKMPIPGAAPVRKASWSDAVITEQPGVTSAREAELLSWVLAVSDVTRIGI